MYLSLIYIFLLFFKKASNYLKIFTIVVLHLTLSSLVCFVYQSRSLEICLSPLIVKTH